MGPNLSTSAGASRRAITLTYCRPQDVAAIIFSETVKYDGCKICSDPESKLYKTYVRDDQDCATAQINLYRYRSTQKLPCPTGGDNFKDCSFDDKQLYGTDNTSDCPEDNYQARKSVYSRALRACDNILKTTMATKPPDGSPIPMTSLCPVPITSFVKCDPVKRKCRYTSESGDAEKVAACTNSFDNCQDSEYLADKEVWAKLNENCAARWESQNNLNFWMLSVSIGVISLILIGIIYTVIRAGAFADRPQSQAGSAVAAETVSGNRNLYCSFRGKGFFFVMVLVLLGGLGFLGYAMDWWKSDDNTISEEENPKGYLYTGIGLVSVAALGVLVWLYATIFGSCVNTQDMVDAKIVHP